jgi:hypothetical protein
VEPLKGCDFACHSLTIDSIHAALQLVVVLFDTCLSNRSILSKRKAVHAACAKDSTQILNCEQRRLQLWVSKDVHVRSKMYRIVYG